MIHISEEHLMLFRICWLLLGVIGMVVLFKIRKEFYQNRSPLYLIGTGIYYLIMGPLTFIISMIYLGVDIYIKKQKK